MHNGIRVATKFQLRSDQIDMLPIKSAQKGYFPSKTEKVKTTIDSASLR